MRVLAVTNSYPSDDTPAAMTFVEQQVEGLRRLGLQMDVLSLHRRHGGVEARTFPFLAASVRAYGGVRKRIRQRVGELRPDLVHVMYGGIMADLVTRAVSSIPVVVSFCGSDLLGEPAPRLAKRLSIRYGVFASYAAARRADGIVVKSSNLRSALPPCIDRGKVWTIPNGIDLERFRPMDSRACRKQLGWKAGGFHVLFSSFPENLCKGFELAQEAVDVLNAAGTTVELHTLRDRPPSEIPIWLNACDCLLLTSHLEGSPNIVKEALACNRGIVSVDVGDVRERLEGIQGCFVVARKARDVTAALSAALSLVGDDGIRVEGRIRMRELSLERIAKRLIGTYREVIERHATVASDDRRELPSHAARVSDE